MALDGNTLTSRTGVAFRKVLASQAEAYRQLGGLLGELAEKKIKTSDFTRRSFDLYVGAVGDVLSNEVAVASDALQTAIDSASKVVKRAETRVVKAGKAAEAAVAETASSAARVKPKIVAKAGPKAGPKAASPPTEA